MHCVTCGLHLTSCICSDRDERLSQLGDVPNVAVKWCSRCDRHYAVCKCEEPAFVMKSNGSFFEIPESRRGEQP